MHLIKLFFLFVCCFTIGLCSSTGWTLLGPKPSGSSNSSKPKINRPNKITFIKVGPKNQATFSEQPIPNSFTNESSTYSNNLKNSTNSNQDHDLTSSASENHEIASSDMKPTSRSKEPRFGFGDLGSNLRPNVPSFDKLKQNLPGKNLATNPFKQTWPSIEKLKSIGELNPHIENFSQMASEAADKFQDIPLVSNLLEYESWFKVNSLKAAIEYMIRYGHLEEFVTISRPEDLSKLTDAFKNFQQFFGLNPSGIFDQKTMELMNKPRCGMPDKETKFTKLFTDIANMGATRLIRRKRFEVHSLKYDYSNLTWTVMEFPKKALKGQNKKVLEVLDKAFKVWSRTTNLNFEYKDQTNTSDILIAFYSGQHGNPRIEPPFDGPNGTLAHTSYPTECDIHFDDDEIWSFYEEENHTDLYSVAIHEIGHKLGLKHTTVKSACLYPIYNPKSTHLDADDVTGIQSLYGVRRNANEKEKEILDESATEKPEADKNAQNSDKNHPNDHTPSNTGGSNGNTAGHTQGSNNTHNNHHDEDSGDDFNDENAEDDSYVRPDFNPWSQMRPSHESRGIKISQFYPENNIAWREYKAQGSKPCNQIRIGPSVCLLNNKCLVISGDETFWIDYNLKALKRRREQVNDLFRGLNGPIDALYRDKDLIHVIQRRNVTTYDKFYAEPIRRTTLDQHFPGLPKHVNRIDSIYKRLTNGVTYIYSGEYYWRYTKKYGLEGVPQILQLADLPQGVKPFLHFTNDWTILIKDTDYWWFSEVTHWIWSTRPRSLQRMRICTDADNHHRRKKHHF